MATKCSVKQTPVVWNKGFVKFPFFKTCNVRLTFKAESHPKQTNLGQVDIKIWEFGVVREKKLIYSFWERTGEGERGVLDVWLGLIKSLVVYYFYINIESDICILHGCSSNWNFLCFEMWHMMITLAHELSQFDLNKKLQASLVRSIFFWVMLFCILVSHFFFFFFFSLFWM